MKQTAKRIVHNRHAKVCAALIAADCLVFSTVNPRHAAATWLITGYVLLGLTIFALAHLLGLTLRSYGATAQTLGTRALRYGAAAVVLMIGLQSIGQLTAKDVLTLLPLVIGLYLYIGYGKRVAMERASP